MLSVVPASLKGCIKKLMLTEAEDVSSEGREFWIAWVRIADLPTTKVRAARGFIPTLTNAH